jgi:hypothetical protein
MSKYFIKLGTEVRYMSEDLFEEKPELTPIDLVTFYNQTFGEMLMADAITFLQSINTDPEVINALKDRYELNAKPEVKV